MWVLVLDGEKFDCCCICMRSQFWGRGDQFQHLLVTCVELRSPWWDIELGGVDLGNMIFYLARLDEFGTVTHANTKITA